MTCPHCGQENPAGAGFCSSCGSALPAAAAVRQTRERLASLRR